MQRSKNHSLLPQVPHMPPMRIKSTSASASGHLVWTLRSLGNMWVACASIRWQVRPEEGLGSLDIWVLCILGGLCFFSGLFFWLKWIVVFGFCVSHPSSEFTIFWAFGLLLPHGSFHKTTSEKSSPTLMIRWKSLEGSGDSKDHPILSEPGWRFAISPISALW